MDSIDPVGGLIRVESDGDIFDLIEANDKGEEDDSNECAGDCQGYFFVSGHIFFRSTIMFVDRCSVLCFLFLW